MTQPAGWYEDPQDKANLRYWDGVEWTARTSPKVKPNLESAGQKIGGDAGAAGQGGQHAGGDSGHEPRKPWAARHPAQAGYAAVQHPSGRTERDVTPDGQPLAGWGRRLMARILDGLLFTVLSMTILPTLFGVPDLWSDYLAWATSLDPQAGLDAGFRLPADLEGDLNRLVFGVGIVALVYEIVLTTLVGGPLGKLAMGIRVRLREHAGNLGWAGSAIRAAIWNLPSSIPIVGFPFTLVNGLWPLWDRRRQALHDKAARSSVVRVR